jgi:hypothetical protein
MLSQLDAWLETALACSDDPDGTPLLTKDDKGTFKIKAFHQSVMSHIEAGCVSDLPGEPMYRLLSFSEDGALKYICYRSSSGNESHHKVYNAHINAQSKLDLVSLSLALDSFRLFCKSGVKLGLYSDLGHLDVFLGSRINDLCMDLFDELPFKLPMFAIDVPYTLDELWVLRPSYGVSSGELMKVKKITGGLASEGSMARMYTLYRSPIGHSSSELARTFNSSRTHASDPPISRRQAEAAVRDFQAFERSQPAKKPKGLCPPTVFQPAEPMLTAPTARLQPATFTFGHQTTPATDSIDQQLTLTAPATPTLAQHMLSAATQPRVAPYQPPLRPVRAAPFQLPATASLQTQQLFYSYLSTPESRLGRTRCSACRLPLAYFHIHRGFCHFKGVSTRKPK